MIQLEFIGAAQTVTGSKHLLRTSKATVLLDCGLFQGPRKESFLKNSNIPIDVKKLDAVVLSHAHIDHSGALPCLIKKGFRRRIFCTPATRDLCSPMLLDAAYLMQADAEHIDHLIKRKVDIEPVKPLYDEDDVVEVLSQMVTLSYHHTEEIAPGIRLTFLDAGHVLGSAISVLDIEDQGKHLRLAFTGDLGRKHLPILRDPEIPDGVNYLITESTYGDRLHSPIEGVYKELAAIINRTNDRGGKIIIPSFALERAQEIIFVIKKLLMQGKIPPLRVFVDSPLTQKLTDVFKLHPECYNRETLHHLQSHDSPFDFPGLNYVDSSEDSKRLDADREPAIIISASGMCEGGRILHHLQHFVENSINTILIVGFQAENTLGRRIVEKRPEIKIFGTLHRLNAEVCVLNGFSAHTDQAGLLTFTHALQKEGQLKYIFLVHGEPKAQTALIDKIKESGFSRISAPKAGDTISLIPR